MDEDATRTRPSEVTLLGGLGGIWGGATICGTTTYSALTRETARATPPVPGAQMPSRHRQ